MTPRNVKIDLSRVLKRFAERAAERSSIGISHTFVDPAKKADVE